MVDSFNRAARKISMGMTAIMNSRKGVMDPSANLNASIPKI